MLADTQGNTQTTTRKFTGIKGKIVIEEGEDQISVIPMCKNVSLKKRLLTYQLKIAYTGPDDKKTDNLVEGKFELEKLDSSRLTKINIIGKKKVYNLSIFLEIFEEGQLVATDSFMQLDQFILPRKEAEPVRIKKATKRT